MKLPFTDKFLWAVYNFYKNTNRALDPLDIFRFKTMKEVIRPCPDFWRALEDKRGKRQFAQFVNYLKHRGYIRIDNLRGKRGILLTGRGMEKVLKIKPFIESSPSVKKRKDKKWIMVIFDIPEKKRRYRDELRRILCALGFQKLQKSVWVSPYDVLGRLEDMVRVYNLDYYIRTFIIEEIET